MTGRRLRSIAAPVAVLVVLTLAVWLMTDASSRRAAEQAGRQAADAARDSITAILSYQPDTAERDLDQAAGERLTGPFLEDYAQLIKTVVVPNATQKRITAAARVPAIAVVSSGKDRAVLLAYIDQTLTVGKDAPTQTNSSVRVSMERVDGRWLIFGFDPIQ